MIPLLLGFLAAWQQLPGPAGANSQGIAGEHRLYDRTGRLALTARGRLDGRGLEPGVYFLARAGGVVKVVRPR